MIYHHAIGDKFLHICLDCTMTPYEIHRYNDRNSHRCHSRKVDQGKQSERGSTLHSYHGLTIYHDDPTKVIQCESTVHLLNRICSSRYVDVGDLSLSHEVRTGRQITEYGTRDDAKPEENKHFDYCPCNSRIKDSLSLNLL